MATKEALAKIPEKKDLDDWDCEQDGRSSSLTNDQFHRFLCLNLKDEVTTVKNMKTKPEVHGVAWHRNLITTARLLHSPQELTNAIYKSHRAKKFAVVVVAMEMWERDISRFKAATWKIAEEAKTLSLRQLVPAELAFVISSDGNTLKTWEQVWSGSWPTLPKPTLGQTDFGQP